MKLTKRVILVGIPASLTVGILILCLGGTMSETPPKLWWGSFGLSVTLVSLSAVLYALGLLCPSLVEDRGNENQD
jgi:hypothetical protein